MSGRAGDSQFVAVLNIPENLPGRKSKVTAFDNGGAMRAPLWRVQPTRTRTHARRTS